MLNQEPTYLSESQWGQVVAKVHSDPSFREAFELDPRQAVEDNKAHFGLTDLTGVRVVHMPDNQDIPDIQAVANGGKAMGSITFGCIC